MNPDGHARAKEIFVAACSLPPEERSAYVKEACGDEPALGREVESLLAFHGPPSHRPDRADDVTAAVGAAFDPGDRIPNYRIHEKIDEGGMGEVYRAEQLEPIRRDVALKVIKVGMDTRAVVARFETERQALALMDHPSIAHVFDAGVTDRGRLYFAMEYVPGEAITTYCDRHQLSTRERLELFTRVCDGVQHAHLKGIIHRDIKPSNVLVRILDQHPMPTIIDFGIAKATQHRLTEKTMYTAMGMMIGTPEYMSPEQAEMTGLDVDTRTDVYSLGVMLYEVLAGALPLDPGDLREAGFDELRRKIREDEPSKPSTRVRTLDEATTETAKRRRTDPPGLRRQLKGDLDWITMKALEKDRTRRYPSPSDLAADIERHLRDEPVVASPPGTLYRAHKFVRRNRVSVIAAALVAAALVVGVIGTTLGLVQARKEAETARIVSGFLTRMFADLNPRRIQGPITTPVEILDRGVERIESELQGQPQVQADLMVTLGSAYMGLGLYDRARPLFERSSAIHRDRLGTDSEAYALSISFLGDLNTNEGRYPEAAALHEQALAIRRKVLGADHVRVSWSLRSLGWVRWRLSDLEAGRSLYEQALETGENAVGPEHLDVATTLFLLALLEMSDYDYEAARQRLERAREIRESVLEPDHPQVAQVLNAIGRVHRETGDPQAAKPFFEQAAAAFEKSLGPDHPELGLTIANIGAVLSAEGDYEGARAHFENPLRIQEKSLGPDHPEVAIALGLYGVLLRRAGDPDGARRSYERALAILEAAVGPDDMDAARTRSYLGYLEYSLGNYDDARRHTLRALEEYRRIFSSGHRALAGPLYNLACLSALEGERDQALEFLREAVACGYAERGLLDDPDFAALRGDTEFEAIVSEVRQRWE